MISRPKRNSSYAMILMSFLILVSGCGIIGVDTSHPIYREMPSMTALPGLYEEEEENLDLLENASLNEILAFGSANNPGLKAAFFKWQASLEKVTVAGALPDPQFGYTYFLQEIETKVGPQQHKLSFSQMIPSVGKLHLKSEVALRDALIDYRAFEAAKEKLFHKLRTAYFNYYYLDRATSLVKENLDRLKMLEPVVKQAYQAGKAPYNNLIRIQIAIEKEQEKFNTLNDTFRNVKFRLNAMLNRFSDSDLPDPKLPAMQLNSLQDEKEEGLLGLLRKYNPELAVLDGKIEKAEKGLQLAQKQDAPNYMFGLDWAITARSDMPAVPENGKDPVMFMFGMNIPLYREKYNAMERGARKMLRVTQKMKHNRENILLADCRIALNDVKTSQRRIELFQKNLIVKAKQSFEVSRTSFTGGKGDFLDMLDNIKLIIEMQLTVEKEILNKAKKISELEMLFGGSLLLIKEEK